MSSVYHVEPPTSGKVVLVTSFGEIEVELWTKEAPVACRNFIQLCMEGYYDNSIIHRVIKTFMVQMGDPTGSGNGGDSVFGEPFKDEFHGRLRFNHRGQVAMANDNTPNTNRSQFFITLGPCEHLNKKHTIFGKVAGQTMYNLLRIGEIETDGSDRPVAPIVLKKIDILLNPFDDISPRELKISVLKSIGGVGSNGIGLGSENETKEKRKAVKDKKLLSFGDDVDDSELHADKDREKLKSSSKQSFSDSNSNSNSNSNSKSSSNSIGGSSSNNNSNSFNNSNNSNSIISKRDDADNQSFESKMLNKMLEKRKQMESKDAYENKTDDAHSSRDRIKSRKVEDTSKLDKTGHKESSQDSGVSSKSFDFEFESMVHMHQKGEEEQKQMLIRDKKLQFDRIRDDLLKSKKAVRVMTGIEAAEASTLAAKTEVASALEQRRMKFVNRKKASGSRESETLARLSSFAEGLRREKKSVDGNVDEDAEAEEEDEETYSGQVMERDEREGIGGVVWHAKPLKFGRHIDDRYRNKDLQERMDDNYVVLDPRLKK